jgi:Lysylphosphatidylglycerol synthase TM region
MWGAAIGWLVLGVLLHLANQVARGRGWHAIVVAAPGGAGVRRRDAVLAWIAGAGAGGIVSARGGDAVRVLLLRKRVPDGGCALVAGTLVAEGAGELLAGVALLGAALALGVGPEVGLSAATARMAAAVAVALAAFVLVARRSARMRALAAGVARGCAPLRDPGPYARRVVPWQLASRACRLAALGCFLAAFGLPVTVAGVLLVAFAQCGGRLVPFAPASVGAGAALLAATYGPVTGTHVSAERLAACFVGTSTVLTVVGTVLALAICLRDQAFARQGRSFGAALAAGRAAIARAAAAPTR